MSTRGWTLVLMEKLWTSYRLSTRDEKAGATSENEKNKVGYCHLRFRSALKRSECNQIKNLFWSREKSRNADKSKKGQIWKLAVVYEQRREKKQSCALRGVSGWKCPWGTPSSGYQEKGNEKNVNDVDPKCKQMICKQLFAWSRDMIS